MQLNKSLSNNLLRLLSGGSVPWSALPAETRREMQAEGAVAVISHGSRRTVKAIDTQRLHLFLQRELDLPNADSVAAVLKGGEASRADLVHLTGDSKFSKVRTMTGFLVNCYEPVSATLGGHSFTIAPPKGSFVYISDFELFSIPADVAVVGVENAENFRFIRGQRVLFEDLLPGRKLLFVSRYPQNGDLLKWLEGITNMYYHFGDLDLAGIGIFQTEFYASLGNRASFLIPKDAEARLHRGSLERYDTQYRHFKKMRVKDPRVQPLVDLIHELHRGYDQEGFIETQSVESFLEF